MPDTISSRTPEGIPNRCPLCNAEVCLEPSQPCGDAPCPRCGSLLWFSRTSEGSLFYAMDAVAPIRDQVVAFVAAGLGASRKEVLEAASLQDIPGGDSLELVETIMELEEWLEITIPDEQAEKIRTIRDLVDAVIQQVL